MAELHETVMGRRLIEHTLPEIARQLQRVADAMENNNVELVRLKERYKTLSELDADPKSTHRINRKVLEEMKITLDKLKK
jgi:Fe-S-cluster formation regulator IscX/YfhJ